MQAWLQVSHPRANLNQIRLLPQTLVGRSPECHLRIATPLVSRRHCRFTLQSDGVYLEDLASANGTLLDGIRLPVLTPTYVRPDAVVEIGPARFVVVYAARDLEETALSVEQSAAPEPAVPGPWLIGSHQTAEEGTLELPRAQAPVLTTELPRDSEEKPGKRGSFFEAIFGRSKPKKPSSGSPPINPTTASVPLEVPPAISPVEESPAPASLPEHNQANQRPDDSDSNLQDFLNKLG
ncbi:FHA domain-containing protein [bacterium]|nr:FHA domain-containing protein [bacterium]